ncbi:MAG: ABC-F family ATP-binding cassette domain-containing protein [Ruminococcaceae bacterium]|nr:ABC-F family ATP-binding cassette domain-containing protein [Oscillospiraceae bacterium]
MVLQLQDICKSFGVDPVLTDISLKVENGEKVGLIGANGAGKSTLLKIITGELGYDSGTMMCARESRIGFLKQSGALNEGNSIWDEMVGVFGHIVAMEQEMRSLEKRMADASLSEEEHGRAMNSYGRISENFDKQGGFELRARIMTVLNGMGFESFDLEQKIGHLSGGEKTKLAMAKMFLEEPDLMLLDEPTNHLDFKTMQWLEGYLKSCRSAVLVVSHDRYFLDALCETVYEIERTRATRYAGNYSFYLEQKKQNREIGMKKYELQQKEIKRMEEYVAKNLVRASTTKMAQSRRKMLEKMERVERPDGDLKTCKFRFEITFPSYKDVLDVNDLTLMVRDKGVLRTLCTNVGFSVKRGEKVALIGANGIGKSTLLKTLLKRHEDYKGDFAFGRNVDVSYYDQEQKTLNDRKTVLNEIWDDYPRMDEAEVRTLLGSLLFTDDDVFKPVGTLSGGERAKLEFLHIMLEKGNLLVLDEPTNHLDLPSKEALDAALAEYDGTILFVSHDRYFVNKIADRVIELTPDGVTAYQGNYDDYLAKRAQATTVTRTQETKKTSYEDEKRLQALIKSRTKKMAETEDAIAQTEERIARLQDELEQAGADYEKVQNIYADIEQAQDELAEYYEKWEGFSLELEELQKSEKS